jgi:hypothetical protein
MVVVVVVALVLVVAVEAAAIAVTAADLKGYILTQQKTVLFEIPGNLKLYVFYKMRLFKIYFNILYS